MGNFYQRDFDLRQTSATFSGDLDSLLPNGEDHKVVVEMSYRSDKVTFAVPPAFLVRHVSDYDTLLSMSN